MGSNPSTTKEEEEKSKGSTNPKVRYGDKKRFGNANYWWY
jgi:hypothetical protein